MEPFRCIVKVTYRNTVTGRGKKIENKRTNLKYIYHNISYKNNAHHRLSLIKAMIATSTIQAYKDITKKGKREKKLLTQFFPCLAS